MTANELSYVDLASVDYINAIYYTYKLGIFVILRCSDGMICVTRVWLKCKEWKKMYWMYILKYIFSEPYLLVWLCYSVLDNEWHYAMFKLSCQ